MKIGVDTTCWANGRGYGRFTRELLAAMVAAAPDDEFVCFLDPAAAQAFDLEAPNLRRVEVGLGASATAAASADGYRSLFDMLRMTSAVSREALDVFFSPSVYTFFPLPPTLPAVVTIHDAIAERFPELTFANSRARIFWNTKVAFALRQARLVLTVSDFSKRDIAWRLGVDENRIRVAVEAPSSIYTPSTPREIAGAAERGGLPTGASWIIYVGGFNPHKYVDSVIRAHGRLARDLGEQAPHLLLVGSLSADVFHGDRAGLRAEIERWGTAEQVHWMGFVPDEELRHLHSGALALVLPSACEGFGLPAVEAAACACPVIATLESPLPELLAGGGFFVKPGDHAAIEAAVRQLWGDRDRRTAMGQAALEATRALSWDAGAISALAALREVSA